MTYYTLYSREMKNIFVFFSNNILEKYNNELMFAYSKNYVTQYSWH